MRRKIELIQQIRAMESVPIIRTKFVDITETGGQGLLVEMSVAEVRRPYNVWSARIFQKWLLQLRERLALMKIAETEEEERKRREILSAKQVRLLYGGLYCV